MTPPTVPKPPTLPTAPHPPALPQIVDEQGKNIIRPDIMNFVMLANIASHTAKTAKTTQALYDHAMDLAGEGLTRLLELTVTATLQKRLLPEAWQSVSITNDGDPNDVEAEPTVYFRVNSLYTDEIPIGMGETLNYDAKTHKLRKLYLRAGSGETAKVRIVGNY